MKKIAIALLLVVGAGVVSSCAATRGGKEKCPAYSTTDNSDTETVRA